ncbi:MAG: hydroxymethylglutaryl-CoA lyase [Thermoactinomyces sp.]
MTGKVHVRLRDVTLRDGLQNEAVFVPTEIKRILLDQIVAAGFRSLEVTSFVRGDRVPALRDADELARSLPEYAGVEYRALVPNERGMQRFLSAKVATAVFFISASPAHNQANLQRTTKESLKEIARLIRLVKEEGRQAVGAIATAFVCPFAGVVPDHQLERIAEELVKSGVKELALADTVGQATPDMVYERCAKIKNRFPFLELSLHLHDSKGYGLRNMLAGMEAGVYSFDVAQAGLGGCPYVPGAPGNLSAIRVLEGLEERGVETGLDYRRVCQLEEYIQRFMKRRNE